jgi:hypothetical protein
MASAAPYTDDSFLRDRRKFDRRLTVCDRQRQIPSRDVRAGAATGDARCLGRAAADALEQLSVLALFDHGVGPEAPN